MIYTNPLERHAKRNNFMVRAVNEARDTRIVHYYERYEWFQVNADKTFERLTLEDAAKRAADMRQGGGAVFFEADAATRFDWMVKDRLRFFGSSDGAAELHDFILHEQEMLATVDDWNL